MSLKLSFCLPVYNGQYLIAQCIESLINQKVKGEIIVYHDGSTDNTKRILDFYKNDINVIHMKERKGHAKGRNLLVQEASGDIIVICDNDIYDENRSQAITEFFDEEEKDVFYSALTCCSSKNPSEIWRQEAYEWDFNSKCNISYPTVAYRRDLALRCPHREDSMETDLYEFVLLEMNQEGAKFGGCQNPLMLKYEGDSLRNKKVAWELKQKIYKEEYGIEIQI
tara:strand:- start:3612 stop:4283 length:672 start_codon:yes stop_codon:yes gene_type:complete